MNASPTDRFWLATPASIAWQPRDFRSSSWSEHVPFAFWIVEALRPETVVELGTWHGMSYLAFCQAIQTLGLATRATAVDTWAGDSQAGLLTGEALGSLRRVHDEKYGAFSKLTQSDFDAVCAATPDNSVDLLHIDGLHTYEAVKHDFETWLPKMSSRGVILFHDTQERHGDFGVYRLWAELSAQYPHFEFVHEHGLGVLGVGSDLPPAIQSLFAASSSADEAASARAVFARLGEGVRARQTAHELGEKLDRVRAHPLIKTALGLRRMWQGNR